jgi:hypothetical protein
MNILNDAPSVPTNSEMKMRTTDVEEHAREYAIKFLKNNIKY